jgi:hypothetical protein
MISEVDSNDKGHFISTYESKNSLYFAIVSSSCHFCYITAINLGALGFYGSEQKLATFIHRLPKQ